ncbi:ABC transporter ATP-binding protein, partial [Thiotrichales bacterium HSG1]|nr:ABC transporter ATP-binding protein [Thiotrichales bacterium HSG1]
VFEGQGKVKEYVGGYQDWLRQRPQLAKPATVTKKTQNKQVKSNKITYNEQRELAKLPNQIENLESELSELHVLVSNSEFYQQDETSINQTLSSVKKLEVDLGVMYKRWEELENIGNKL